jgi:hypothetical protein
MAGGKPFQKGADERRNAGGRPKEIGHVKDLARAQTESAINTLIEIASGVEHPSPARVAAATALLDRGWGKPTQMIGGDAEAGPVQTVVTWERGK